MSSGAYGEDGEGSNESGVEIGKFVAEAGRGGE
jgi:hypothetical protein